MGTVALLALLFQDVPEPGELDLVVSIDRTGAITIDGKSRDLKSFEDLVQSRFKEDKYADRSGANAGYAVFLKTVADAPFGVVKDLTVAGHRVGKVYRFVWILEGNPSSFLHVRLPIDRGLRGSKSLTDPKPPVFSLCAKGDLDGHETKSEAHSKAKLQAVRVMVDGTLVGEASEETLKKAAATAIENARKQVMDPNFAPPVALDIDPEVPVRWLLALLPLLDTVELAPDHPAWVAEWEK